MKKIFKITTAVILVISVLFTFAACNSSKDNQEEILNHLSNKYNEEFEIEELKTSDTHRTKQEYYCHSVSYPDKSFLVAKNKKEYKDGYFGILAQEKCQNKVDKIIKSNSGDYKFFCEISGEYFNEDFNDIDKLSEYLKNTSVDDFNINFYLFVVDETKCDIDKIMEEINKIIPKYTIHLNLIIEDQLNKINSDNYKTYYNSTETAYETTVEN